MKKRPILFNDEMVRAILDGRKTQTRRVVKSIDHDLLDMMSEDAETGAPDSELLELLYGPSTDDNAKSVADQWMVRCTECPEEGVLTLGQGFGRVGDRLWVREAWREFNATDECGCSEAPCACPESGTALYRASHDDGESKWRPSIHMPRWASRITLEITDVRVERLQDISEKDARAEGVPGEKEANAAGLDWFDKPRRAFRFLWQSIIGPESWNENPWVWVIEFKRVVSEGHY
jgi:hypothetical protein